MKLIIISAEQEKSIAIDGKYLRIENADFSWFPSEIYAVQWTGSSGEVETHNEGNYNITELGIFSKAEETFNEERNLREIARQKEEEEWDLINDWGEDLRMHRDQYLKTTDWVVIKAKETSTNIPAAWKSYRQALRDLPATVNPSEYIHMCKDLNHSLWPIKPSS